MPNINTRFTLSGEREYRAAISQIGEGMRVLNAEMRKVSSEYAKNADSVDALIAKNDVLERKISTQVEKITYLKEALQQSAEKYGEADKRTMRWQASLNNAEAELNGLNTQLAENNEKIKEASKENDSFTGVLGKVKAAFAESKKEGTGLRGVISKLKDSFGDSKKSAVGLGDTLTDTANKLGVKLPDGAANALKSLNGVSAGAAAAAAALAAVVVAVVKVEQALIDLTKESASAADDILTLSSVTGLSTDAIQEFSYMSDLADVSLDRIKDSLKETTNKMQEAAAGSGAAYEAYKQLHVEIQNADGSMRSAVDVFYDTIEALGEIDNQAQRDALAMDLMSESAQELNPIIELGGEKLRAYAQEAHDMGAVLNEDALTALQAVDDAYSRLEKTQDSVKNQLASEFAPYLEDFYGHVTNAIDDLGGQIADSGIVDAFGALLSSVSGLIDPTGELATNEVPALTMALRPLALVITLIADTLDIINGLVQGITGKGWDRFKRATGYEWATGGRGNYTETLFESWSERDAARSNNVTNNYYTVDVASARSVAQIAESAESARQQNRKYGR